MHDNDQLILLASASPRRLALLEQIGIACRVEPAHIDESVRQYETATEYVTRLADEKSSCVYRRTGHHTVLGADTAISFNGEILGKPNDCEQAISMISRLSGCEHEVLTGVSIRSQLGVHTTVCTTSVRLRQLEYEQIRAYCRSGEPVGKAGSYAIQGLGGILVEYISGSYSNVVGLPLYETSLLLEKSGMRVLRMDCRN